MKQLIITIISLLCLSANAQQKFTADWESLKQHKAVPQWFSDVEFGVYFTWGVYSVPAEVNEWYPRVMYIHDMDSTQKWWWWAHDHHEKTWGKDFHYHDFIPMWKAEHFDAKEWLDQFENMGVQFVGAIAEHHDGFSLWDSKVNPWNAAQMGPQVDIVKAIADETRQRDMKFMATFHHGFHGLYYPKDESSLFLRPNSIRNRSFHNCKVPQDDKYRLLYGNYSYEEMNQLWLDKLNEVVESVMPDYCWFDFGQKFIAEEYRQQFLADYFNKAEAMGREVAVNTKGDFFPEELAMVNIERSTMADIQDEVWIADFILGSYWSYNKHARYAMSPNVAIRLMADIVSKNGVLLLSAGPKADGTLPEEQVATMEGIGRWMRLYGEAIYQTTPFDEFGQGPTQFINPDGNHIVPAEKTMKELNAKDVRYTRKGSSIYAIQLGWDADNSTKLLTAFAKAKGYKVKSVKVLGSNERIQWEQTPDGLKVTQPKNKPAEADVALVYKIEVK